MSPSDSGLTSPFATDATFDIDASRTRSLKGLEFIPSFHMRTDSPENEDTAWPCTDIEYRQRLLDHVSFPAEWADEGVEPPTRDAIVQAREVLRRIYLATNSWLPTNVVSSIEGGVFLAYRGPLPDGRTFAIEVLNGGESAAVVSRDGAVLASFNLVHGNDLDRLVSYLKT